ncbi:sulfurtransferase TusA family protein [Clostridium sp. Marseille-QA1073]
MSEFLDCVGYICPVPVVKAQIKYKKIDIGECVTVISDHSCTPQGLKDGFKKYNCEITVEEDDGIWEITIKKLG